MSLTDATKNCFRGRKVPGSLEKLWSRREAGDQALSDMFMIVDLLSDLTPLDAGYGEPMAQGSPDGAANVKAHREVFEQLAFFAELEDSEVLAYYLGDSSPEPPVVKLDNEGQYAWKGRNAAEALFQISDGRSEPDAARAWLEAAGLELGAVHALGVSTQFLPNLTELQSGMYYANVNKPRPARAIAAAPADPRDPQTWLLRPGPEVKAAIERRLGAPLTTQNVFCDGAGLVTTVALDASVAPEPILGIALGTLRGDVEKTLGAPEAGRGNWLRFRRDDRLFRFEFDEQNLVTEISLMLVKVQ